MAWDELNYCQTELSDLEGLSVYGEQISIKKAEVDSLGLVFDGNLSKLSDQAKVEFEKDVDALLAGQITETELLGKYPNRDTPEHRVRHGYIRATGIMRDIKELEEKHKPLKAYEVNLMAEELNAKFDWEVFMNYYENSQDNEAIAIGLETTLVIRQVLFQNKQNTLLDIDYQMLNYWQKHLETQTTEWSRRGFLRENYPNYEEKPISQEQVREQRIRLKNDLRATIDILTEYGNLKNAYRSQSYNYTFKDRFLQSIVCVLDIENENGYMNKAWRECDFDPRFLDVVNEHIRRRVQKYHEEGLMPETGYAYAEHLEQAKQVELNEVLGNIRIEVLEQKPGEVLLVNEAQLRELIGKTVPAAFLTKMESIIATEKSGHRTEQDAQIETIGDYKPEIDKGGSLISGKIEIYAQASVPEGSSRGKKAYTKEEFEATILHEIAHRIHHELTYTEMRAWEQVTRDDNTEVTWYVGHMKEKSIARGKLEDFSETYQMAILSPGFLYVRSPDRFNYMVALITRYMGDHQRNIFVKDIEMKINSYMQGVPR